MATQIVNGNRVFAQPEIDGGSFQIGTPAPNVLIVTRFANTQSILVSAAASSGSFPTGASVPVQIYNASTLGSSGGYIASGSLTAGVNYSWIAIGVGG
jgi:hypothetical protein